MKTRCVCGEPTASRDEALCPPCRDRLPHVAGDLSDEEKAAVAIAWGAGMDAGDVVRVLVRAAKRALPVFMRESLGTVKGLRGVKVLYSDLGCAEVEARHRAGETLASIATSLGIDDSALRMRMRERRKRMAKEARLRKKSPPEK